MYTHTFYIHIHTQAYSYMSPLRIKAFRTLITVFCNDVSTLEGVSVCFREISLILQLSQAFIIKILMSLRGSFDNDLYMLESSSFLITLSSGVGMDEGMFFVITAFSSSSAKEQSSVISLNV